MYLQIDRFYLDRHDALAGITIYKRAIFNRYMQGLRIFRRP